MSWFRNVISGAAGVAVVVILPAVMLFKGGKEVLEDNPADKQDRLSGESYVHDGKQFAEGATFGVYDAENGVTPEGVGDLVYDAGKNTLEFGSDMAKRIFDRASKDLEGVDIPSLNGSTTATSSEPNCDDPRVMAVTEKCWEL